MYISYAIAIKMCGIFGGKMEMKRLLIICNYLDLNE